MKITWLALFLVAAFSVVAAEPTNFQVRVVADGVNLRVRPDAGTEVVSQVQEGQLLGWEFWRQPMRRFGLRNSL